MSKEFFDLAVELLRAQILKNQAENDEIAARKKLVKLSGLKVGQILEDKTGRHQIDRMTSNTDDIYLHNDDNKNLRLVINGQSTPLTKAGLPNKTIKHHGFARVFREHTADREAVRRAAEATLPGNTGPLDQIIEGFAKAIKARLCAEGTAAKAIEPVDAETQAHTLHGDLAAGDPVSVAIDCLLAWHHGQKLNHLPANDEFTQLQKIVNDGVWSESLQRMVKLEVVDHSDPSVGAVGSPALELVESDLDIVRIS